MRFADPWWLVCAPAVLLILLVRTAASRGAVRFPSVKAFKGLPGSVLLRLAHLPLWLRVLVLILILVALARPQQGHEEIRERTQGVAMEMVVDRSGSMGVDMQYRGRNVNRLDVVKKVFNDFVLGDGKKFEGRPSDLIGLITFAKYPETLCPLVHAHDALVSFLKSTQLAPREEDGTSIGDALALACARLKMLSKDMEKAGEGFEIKSKVVVLLTDGRNNAGKHTPAEAAELAAKWGIKIYTIGIGGSGGMMTVTTPFGNYKMPAGQDLDEDTLTMIAEKTGGLYRRAGDEKSLERIAEEIDRLEKSEVESVRYVDYSERFIVFAVLALVLLLTEFVLKNTLLRRLP